MASITKLSDVVDWRLCIGCGACAYICPKDKVQLWDFLQEGIRPVVDSSDQCRGCNDCLDVCPAVSCDFGLLAGSTPPIGDQSFTQDWGQVLEVWEGHATDPDIRFKGSSGGVLTALSAYCVEAGGMHGVLHVAQHPTDPVRNQTRMSRTRTELVTATGSRYSPASVCDGLDQVESAPEPCVVIGKPGEIAALRKAESMRPALKAKVGLSLSFFCAETPSTGGTLALLAKLGVTRESVVDLRYRGFGWPGYFAPILQGQSEAQEKMPYGDSWAFLQAYRPWSIHLWPDGTGELADISCGDPWYEEPDGTNPGFSLLAVRTERGKQIVKAAIDAGYITVQKAEPWKLVKSQQYLADKKAAVWGRLLAVRLFGLPTPRFVRAYLFSCWRNLSIKDRVKTVVGTARRIFTRKLYKPLKLDHSTAVLVKGTTTFSRSPESK